MSGRRKVLVCGSRDWGDYEAIKRRLSQQDVLIALVIHGGAKGADRCAESVCIDNSVHTFICHPRWDAFGRAAGPLRNEAMLQLEPDLVIAFTTGSPGTQHTINEARKRGIPVEVHGTERPDTKGEDDAH